MNRIFFVLALGFSAASPAFADEVLQSTRSEAACLELLRQAEAGLKSNRLHDIVRERLQQMLETGRSGNVLACQDIANGSLSSQRPVGTSCDKPAV
jgi:hypothetical protein